jgi:hypothetical protein
VNDAACERRYIPVPVWDGEQWRPCDFCQDGPLFGHAEMPWPEGFDPSTIPLPKFRIGQQVQFNWDKGIRQGVVESIQKHGGGHHYDDRAPIAVAIERYAKPPTYIVYWNAHGRMVSEPDIFMP